MCGDCGGNAERALCNCAQLWSPLTRRLWSSVNSEAAWAPLFQTRNEAQIMGSKRFLIIAAAAVLALSCYGSVSLSQSGTRTTKPTDESVRVQHSAAVLREIM